MKKILLFILFPFILLGQIQVGSDIDGEAAGDLFGHSVSINSDGSIIAIGARSNDGNGSSSGHVRVYENISDVWTQIGSDIDGEAPNDFFWDSVSLSSDGIIVAIGARDNDGNGISSGHVRVYENISNTWTQIGQDINGESVADRSGSSVSLSSDGTIVAIGAPGNNGNGSFSGHVRVYKNMVGTWIQIGNDINGEAADDNSGDASSVSLSSNGSIVAIGARGNNNSGHVRVYKNISNTWTQIGQDINGEASFDKSGSVSLSSDGSILTIGATGNDDNGTDSGHVRVYDLSALLSSNSFDSTQFNIYPNPVKDQFTIKLQQSLELQKVNIYNSLGQLISSTTKRILDTAGLSSGLYYVEVMTNIGITTKKLVIE